MTHININGRRKTFVCGSTDALINSFESANILSKVTMQSNAMARNRQNRLREKGLRTHFQNMIIFMALTLLCTCFQSQSDTNTIMNSILVDAFMTPTPILPIHQSNSILTQHQHSRQQSRKSNSSRTSLRMVNTKSGGKPIVTVEQFQSEVLLQTQQEIDGEVSMAVDEKEKNPILVLYSAPWCGPCRLTNPIVQQISKQYTDILDVVEICTDDLPTIAESAGVVSIPTIQLYYGGRCYDTIVGCVTKNVLSSAIDKVLDDLGLLVVDEDQSGNTTESDDDDDDDDNGSKESSNVKKDEEEVI